MRYLVTGAGGFIGSWILNALLKQGEDADGVDKVRSKYSPVKTLDRLYMADLSERKEAEALISNVQPEVLVHLAANAREGASQFQPVAVTRDGLTAYVNTLEACIKHGVKRVVFFSSMAVYGDQRSPFAESMPRMPVDIYGVNKTAQEQVTEILSEVHGFSYTIIRPHNVFGEGQSLSDKYRNVVGIFINRIMREESLFVYGDGEQKRAFSYIEDSMPAFMRVVCADNYHKQIFNIGGTRVVTVNQMADVVLESFGRYRDTWKMDYLPERPMEVRNAWGSWDKSVAVLNYKDIVGWEEGVGKMVAWSKQFGPQEWSSEPLDLINNKTPVVWLND